MANGNSKDKRPPVTKEEAPPVPDLDPSKVPPQVAQFLANRGAIPANQADDETMALVQKLVDGEVPPTNQFVAYLVEKARVTQRKFLGAQSRAEALRTELDKVEKAVIGLQGQFMKYVEDIKEWANRPDPDPVKVTTKGKE